MVPPATIARSIAQLVQLARHDRLTLLTDLDGTLIPFAASPAAADLCDRPARHLNALSALGVRVVVVSGRPLPQVERLRSLVPGAWWVAEHGAWRQCDGGPWTCAVERAPEMNRLDAMFARLAARFPGARTERKTASACLHWRQVDPGRVLELRRAAEHLIGTWLRGRPDHELLTGVAMVEVRPRTMHKGTAVEWVRGRLPGAGFIAIGDDVTDEEMFAALADGDISIRVGASPPHDSRTATFVEDIEGSWRLLRWLAEARRGVGTIAAPPVRFDGDGGLKWRRCP